MTTGVMFLLDANVISEMMKRNPDPGVSAFLDDTLHEQGTGIATITIFEIMSGIGRLPEGRRRDGLAESFNGVVRDYFAGRIFDFTQEAANACAAICEKKRRTGEPLDDHLEDAMLAGIAAANRLSIVTRNEREFRHTGVEIVNPWNVTP